MSRIEDLTVKQNADLSVNVTALDNSGNAKDLDGYTATASLKKRYNSTESVSFSTEITTPNTGIITISLTNQQTAILDYNDRYVYDVIISTTVANTTIVERVQEGKIFVRPGVSAI